MKPKPTMGAWRARKMVKGQRASQTTGRQKGIVASSLAKHMCRHNRSYKHPEYAAVMAGIGTRKQK